MIGSTTTGRRVLGDTRNARHIELSTSLRVPYKENIVSRRLLAVLVDDGDVLLHLVEVAYDKASITTLALEAPEFADLVSAVTAYRAEVEARGGPLVDDDDDDDDGGDGDTVNDRDNASW